LPLLVLALSSPCALPYQISSIFAIPVNFYELAEPPTGPIMTFLINLIISFVLAIAGFLVLLITQLVMGYKAYEQVAVLLGIIYLLFVLFLVIKVIIINSYLHARKYPSLMNRWRNSYQCQRCDAEFILMG
jgi:hypothetical protein